MSFFDNGFNYVDKFFSSLNNYLNYNSILVIALSIFLVAFIIVLITTSCSYEAKLINAIDMFNNYFMKNPQITAENLLDFNNKMKSKKVPKQLRKQWQQFVLYRDKSASEYMSFEQCVSSPIKNSTYKRDVKILNYVCYILSLISFIANIYFSLFEAANISLVLQHTLLCPALLIIFNLLITIFFDIRHNAIVSDLNQNYQYFEVNMDRATSTVPEYVDYELLFDKNEIKKGIPVLYTYLQRRAEEEKKELERARLKNVEHEKFNFDEAGVAKSLVLERAMQEAENYIAERGKFLQDTEQINSEITQEEINFREITKEYQREMQVSKETFENFKNQLGDASSSIEANYLKKQQQQELDRQRNLERDYDTATERHNQLMRALQEELDEVNDQLKQARTSLERGMMSEFDSYSQKVYADAERVVREREGNEKEQQKQEIANLKAQVESLTNLNKNLMENKDDGTPKGGYEFTTSNPVEYENNFAPQEEENIQEPAAEQDLENSYELENTRPAQDVQQNYTNTFNPYNTEADMPDFSDPGQLSGLLNVLDDDYLKSQAINNDVAQNDNLQPEFATEPSYETAKEDENKFKFESDDDEDSGREIKFEPDKDEDNIWQDDDEDEIKFEPDEKEQIKFEPNYQPSKTNKKEVEHIFTQPTQPKAEKATTTKTNISTKTEKASSQTEKASSQKENISTKKEAESAPKKAGKRGRPRKVKTGPEKPKRPVGRPRKIKTAEELNKPKRGRGRPRKIIIIQEGENLNDKTAKTQTGKGNAKNLSIVSITDNSDIKDIDNYLKEIDNQIAEENAKMEASQKELEKNSRIRKRRKNPPA